jgi:hypothetical protein
MLITRAAFDRIGLFDARLRVGEMIDWVSRLDADGAPTAMVDHLVMRRRIHGSNTMLQGEKPHLAYLRILKASLDRKAASGKTDNRT